MSEGGSGLAVSLTTSGSRRTGEAQSVLITGFLPLYDL